MWGNDMSRGSVLVLEILFLIGLPIIVFAFSLVASDIHVGSILVQVISLHESLQH